MDSLNNNVAVDLPVVVPQPAIYRQDEIEKAVKNDDVVCITATQADADAIIKHLPAGVPLAVTCGLTADACTEYAKVLTGADVCIITATQAEADSLVAVLMPVASSLMVSTIPEAPVVFFNNFGMWADFTKQISKGKVIKEQAPKAKKLVPDANLSTETQQLHSEFFKILSDGNIKDKSSAMANIVLDALLKKGKLYYNQTIKSFDTSMFYDFERHTLLKISSDEFRSWLASYTGVNRADTKYKFFIAGIETASLNDKHSQGIIPARFWQAKDNCIYISNGDGHICKVSAGKYEICDNGTDGVLFEAGYTLGFFTLTAPKNPFECSLFKSASYADQTGNMLLQLYALSLPTNPRCKPPLVLTSPVGGGKTRTAVGLCEVFGITPRISKVLKEGENDFWTTVNVGGILIMDNADTKTEWLADAVATASTGGSHEKRMLYTDAGTCRLEAKSWQIVTSANPTFATDAGLADRTLLIRLQRRSGETADSVLSDEINSCRDAGMSFICDILSKALADTQPTPKALNKRHPDFANMAVRIGRALGKEQEAIKALQAAELDKSKFNLENDDLGSAILAYMATDPQAVLEGTAANILSSLKSVADFDTDYWSPKKVGKRLIKLWPHLAELYEIKAIDERTNKSFKIANVLTNSPVLVEKPKVEILQNPENTKDCTICTISEADLAKVPMRAENNTFSKTGGSNGANGAEPVKPVIQPVQQDLPKPLPDLF